VVPHQFQTPEFMAALNRAAAEHDIPLEMLSIGNAMNSINPNTGAAEFGISDWFSGLFSSKTAAAANTPRMATASSEPYYYEGPEMEKITITTPREQGLVQLPQNLPNSGFYSYHGKPGDGEAQYGQAPTMGLIGETGARLRAAGAPPMGVGDLSLQDGSKYGGHGLYHQNGLAFDARPVRSDGHAGRVNIHDPAYDRQATQRLVDTLRATGGVDKIFFNDPEIKGVAPWKGHDDHLHVQVNPSWTRRR
jgi:penicillin-insensitive murein endopeptidase